MRCLRACSDDRLNDLAGRLVIAWGDAERAWIQRADRQDKDVLELRQAFREADFPGFTRSISSLSKIEELPATWIAALSSSPAPAMTGRQRQWVKLFDTWYNLGPQRRSRPRLGSAAIFGICRSTALVTGMVVDTYVMRRLRKLVPTGKAHFDWHVAPRNAGELLVWEAFVTNQNKAMMLVTSRTQSLPFQRSSRA